MGKQKINPHSYTLTKEHQFSKYSIPIFTHILSVEKPMPLHNHEFSELMFILSGSAKHQLNNNIYRVEKGDIFLILGHTPHRFYECEDLRLINIMFILENLNLPMDSLLEKPGFRAFFDLEPKLRELHDFSNHLVVMPTDLEYLQRLHGDLLFELENSPDGAPVIPSAILLHLITVLSDLYAEYDMKMRVGYTSLSHALYFIEKNFDEKIELEDIIKASNMSSSTLLRKFKRAFQTTPMNYLKEYRIKKSLPMLERLDYPITNIALDCGFINVNHFSRVFAEIMNMPPSQYRKQLIKDALPVVKVN